MLCDCSAEMLYVNPLFGRYIETAPGEPMDEPTSDSLLKTLYDQANFPEFQVFSQPFVSVLLHSGSFGADSARLDH